MENLINFIIGDATTFEPRAIVGIIVFVLIFDGLSFMVASLTGGRR